MLVALIDFAINLVILAGLMVWYGLVPGWHIVLLPVFVGWRAGRLGPAMWAAALIVDIATSATSSRSSSRSGSTSPRSAFRRVVPEEWRFLYSLNPWSA